MIRTSLVIAVYNEINYIQKTLESVVGDADEIILADNASTDGTSDICQSFANRYPEIKYTRHKENMGMAYNGSFAVEKASGKYIRFIGAHDMVSIGSTRNMADILDKNPDAVMAFPKYIISLNPNYSFKFFQAFEEYAKDLSSESALIRAKSITKNCFTHSSISFGLFRAEVLRKAHRTRVSNYNTDGAFIHLTAIAGKMLADEKSIFFRMWPERDCNTLERWKKMYVKDKADMSDFVLPFGNIAQVLDITLEHFRSNREFCEYVLLTWLLKCGIPSNSNFRLKLQDIPNIVPGKENFASNLMDIMNEYYASQPNNASILV